MNEVKWAAISNAIIKSVASMSIAWVTFATDDPRCLFAFLLLPLLGFSYSKYHEGLENHPIGKSRDGIQIYMTGFREGLKVASEANKACNSCSYSGSEGETDGSKENQIP